jgi:hypothetical protein
LPHLARDSLHNVAGSICDDVVIKAALADALRHINVRDRKGLDHQLNELSSKLRMLVADRISKDIISFVNPYSIQVAESIDRL